MVPNISTISGLRRKPRKTLEAIFARPISANIQWRDIEALFVELGAVASIRKWFEQHGVEP